MTFNLDLAYGHETIGFEFSQLPAILKVTDPTAGIFEKLFRRRVMEFLDSVDLDLECPALVVADKTRLCEYPRFLPVLVDVLAARGAAMDRLSIFIAYGTHEQQSEAECRKVYGPIYDQHHWVHHRCDEGGVFANLGQTLRGTPVRMRSDIMAASCVITFGPVSHHYFAGYGGGRKLIFPGLGEKAAIYSNHGLFLDRTKRRFARGCRAGVLAGNPLAEDLDEVEMFRPADMAVHGILDSHGQVCDLMVGRGSTFFRTACARHGAHCEVAGGQYDLVLASCGGYPKDINFIQSHKAFHNAAAFVRDRGRLLVLAHCEDGIGSQTFLPWFKMGDWGTVFDHLATEYVGNGGTALAMMDKLRRIRISLVTMLDQSMADTIGFERISAEQAQTLVNGHRGELAVIPNAGVLVRAP